MKKRNLSRLALLGVTSGLIAICQSSVNASQSEEKQIAVKSINADGKININQLLAAHKCAGPHGCPGEKETKNTKNSNKDSTTEIAEKDKEDGNLGYHVYTEDELMLELNDNGIALYNSLDQEGKALARLVASQRCQQTNECKGLNACQTDKNKCAGKGECKGQGKCAFSDKNLAVKVVVDKMAKKRAEANKSMK